MLTLSVRLQGDSRLSSYSRALPLPSYDSKQMAAACLAVIKKENSSRTNQRIPPIICMGVSASKFDEEVSSYGKINSFFARKDTSLIVPQVDLDPDESLSVSNALPKDVERIRDLTKQAK